MDGERLDLFFKRGKMDHAIVSGKAQSTYFYVKKDRTVSGKNEAAGDTINIIFDPLKNAVKTLRLLGRSTIASGRYVDLEKEQRNKAAKEKARRDSLAAAGIPDTTGLTKLQGAGDNIASDSTAKPSPIRKSGEPRLKPMKNVLKRAKETKKKEESP